MKSILSIFFTLSFFLFCSAQIKDSITFIKLGKTKLTIPYTNQSITDISAGNGYATYTTEDGNIHLITSNKTIQKVSFGKKKIVSSSTSRYHTTMLFDDNTIEQCSFVPDYRMYVPTKLVNIESIDAGDLMSVGITDKSYMYIWGKDTIVKHLRLPYKLFGVKQASVGEKHITFINIKDKVFVYDKNGLTKKEIPNGSKPIKVSTGHHHSLLLDDKGIVSSWGDTSYQQHLIPDFEDKKVIDIDANGNLSLALLENNTAIIWSNGKKYTYDLNKLGAVKKVKLGKDFLMVSFSYQKPEIPLTKKEMKKNTITFKKIKAETYSKNSNGKVIFEGSNNHIEIIKNGGSSKSVNNNQTIIFKGSGHNKQFVYNNINSTLKNNSDTVVIDLDKLDDKNTYTNHSNFKYSNKYEKHPTKHSSETSHLVYDSEETFSFEQYYPKYEPVKYVDPNAISQTNLDTVKMNNIISSEINQFPVSGGIYAKGFFYYDTRDKQKEWYSDTTFLGNCYNRAQFFFYMDKKEKGINSLKNCYEGNYSKADAFHALYDIYHNGLFDIPKDLKLAREYAWRYKNLIEYAGFND